MPHIFEEEKEILFQTLLLARDGKMELSCRLVPIFCLLVCLSLDFSSAEASRQSRGRGRVSFNKTTNGEGIRSGKICEQYNSSDKNSYCGEIKESAIVAFLLLLLLMLLLLLLQLLLLLTLLLLLLLLFSFFPSVACHFPPSPVSLSLCSVPFPDRPLRERPLQRRDQERDMLHLGRVLSGRGNERGLVRKRVRGLLHK